MGSIYHRAVYGCGAQGACRSMAPIQRRSLCFSRTHHGTETKVYLLHALKRR